MYCNAQILEVAQKETSKISPSEGRSFKAALIICVGLFIVGTVALFMSANELPESRLIYVENIQSNNANARVVSCYYNIPDRDNSSALLPNSLHPHLCTHINVAFAPIKDKKIILDDNMIKTIREIVNLKSQNPELKVLLSVGGAGNNNGFSEMVVDHASRKTFIRCIKYILHNYELDGIDLDWEFPVIHNIGGDLAKRERQHFSQLLREIRMEYLRERKNYLLTVAVAAQQVVVDVAYDVDQINLYVDYANIMTYDFHYYTKFTPFTGLNAPLYARQSERFYMATLNINYTVQMYLNKGLDESKLVVGIPTYGHSFTLVNSQNANIESPVSGFGQLGNLGFVNYPDICKFVKSNKVTVNEDLYAKVPYLHYSTEWVSYDTPKSVMEKAQYIKKHNLRGAMIYSLNADDYLGTCAQLSDNIRFPLSESVKNSLLV
ncbi:chitinase-3-like protein 1 [Leptidea sinapis]|uniref:GH18 domain-containing protein n=1 Tax=Leptidea sinapis TaxID=189913 RepID=A0A5E4Q9S5_9NEOP|nr:chitinase-3-like protein 1 [Leptidea sinapis]VVC93747.1 unnamed protein product [Leptidea sinapis]